MNTIFEKLIYAKVETFVYEYNNVSREIFVDKAGSLIHPGEFGMYREKMVSELLKPFLPTKLAVGTGFIITHQNHISTQCDIIIYDKENTPIIENGEQRFFPIECVVGVIEVKSVLSKSNLKEALQKLSNIKALRSDISSRNPYVYKDGNFTSFDPKENVKDQIATFLICERFDFDYTKNKNDIFKDIYGDIDKSLYHNMVLSLKDGVCLYHDGKKIINYPYWNYADNSHKHVMIVPSETGYKYEHIVLFVNYLYMQISSVSTMFIEMTTYLSASRDKKMLE